MSQSNPYSPPSSRIERERQPEDLAGRGERFGAALIDSILLMALVMPIFWFGGYFDAVREASRGGRSMLPLIVVSGAVSVSMYLVVQGWPLYKSAQTWGKKLVGIRIVDLQGQQASFSRLILYRLLPLSVLGRIPLLGMLFVFTDIFMIFRADRRCAHDLIAGTRVVKMEIG